MRPLLFLHQWVRGCVIETSVDHSPHRRMLICSCKREWR